MKNYSQTISECADLIGGHGDHWRAINPEFVTRM